MAPKEALLQLPWPWSIATVCFDTSNGQVLNWPMPNKDYQENEFVLAACHSVWRVVHLFHKPKTVGTGKSMKSNWSPEDVDFGGWLADNAWNGWVLHLKDKGDGEPA